MYCSTYPRATHCSLLLASCSFLALAMSAGIATARDDDHHRRFFDRDSLVISSSTYDPAKGALAALMAGTQLPNTATETISAVSDNNYVTVWNNAKVDGSFGVTSPIELTDVDAFSGRVRHRLAVPTDQVVTSFSSKSELGLHFIRDWRGPHLVFVAYAEAEVGALDVSNSDAVAGQDPTNPVTFAFGSNYAFHRTIVSMDDYRRFAYTPTIAYGGNNGRSALLGSNGLYYAVGNANNGNAATFGPSNGTNPDVTQTTGLEVVNPINAPSVDVSIPADNSAQVDPLLHFDSDKPGKDNNYRGVTEIRRCALLHQRQRQQRYRHGLYSRFAADPGERGLDHDRHCAGLPDRFRQGDRRRLHTLCRIFRERDHDVCHG